VADREQRPAERAVRALPGQGRQAPLAAAEPVLEDGREPGRAAVGALRRGELSAFAWMPAMAPVPAKATGTGALAPVPVCLAVKSGPPIARKSRADLTEPNC
jgi:hypothetical protein